MNKWTPEQLQAIVSRQENLLVSAAAGSGKTAVLIERILRLVVEEQIPVDRLLVVTFTKAAAGEMKERLRKALTRQLGQNPERDRFVREQLLRLNNSWITTFHGFCRQILLRHFQEVGLDPAFQVLGGAEGERLRHLAVEQILEESYESGDPAFMAFAERYSGNRTDQRLGELILGLHSFIMSQPEPWEWLARSADLYRQPLDDAHPWERHRLSRLEAQLTEVGQLLDHAITVAAQEDGPAEYLESLQKDASQTARLLQQLEHGREAFDAAASALEKVRIGVVSAKRKAQLDPLKIEIVKALRDDAWKQLKVLQEVAAGGDSTVPAADLQRLAPCADCLVELVRRFDHCYGQLKAKDNGLDYNDLEHKALELLKNEDLRQSYRQYFTYLFIDEYQDSNRVQEAMLEALENGSNRFMVGDVKQSIYRFRLAEPSLFVAKQDRYTPEGDGGDRRVDLNRNFRSCPEVIGAINHVFEAVMNRELGDVAYDASARLVPGAGHPPAESPVVTLTLSDLKGDRSDGDDEADLFEDLSAAEQEGRLLVQALKGAYGQPIWDDRRKEHRPALWADMAVLLRAVKPWQQTLTQVLADAGIPLQADVGADGGDSFEVLAVLNLLKLLDNQWQDLPLLSVMRSPFGLFTAEELGMIRAEHPVGSFREAVGQRSQAGDPLGDRCRSFLDRLRGWQRQAHTIPLGDFLWNLFDETGFFTYCEAMGGGMARRRRLSWLVDRADDWGARGSGLPGGLAEVLEQQLQRGELPPDGDGSETAGVQLMSIHRSKGLEFPIVHILGLGRQFNKADLREDVLKHRDLGFGLRYVDPELRIRRVSLPVGLIQESLNRETLSEEMRVLYVAMTRAMNQLHLYGSVKKLEARFAQWRRGTERYFMKKAGSYLDWVVPSLIQDTGSQEELQPQQLLGPASGSVLMRLVGPVRAIEPEQEPTAAPETAEAEALGWNLEQWPWQDPSPDGTRIPSKLSATGINRMSREVVAPPEPEPIRQPGAPKPEGVTGAEIGSLHHLVLQHLELNPVMDATELRRQAEGLVQRRILAESDLELLQFRWLEGMFRSTLGQRLLASDTVHREMPFVLLRDYAALGGDGHGEVLVQGVIDCCFREPEGWVLLDYKTDRFMGHHAAESKYGTQLQLYRDALAELTGEPVKETWLYLLQSGDSIEIK